MKPLIASPLVAIAILACSEATAPTAYAGSYPFRTVNGLPVPAAALAVPDSCTEAFGPGTLTLGDGAFSLTFSSGFGCPGQSATAYALTIGGSLSGGSFPMVARAIDPMASSVSTMEMTLSVSGSDAILTLPPGAMKLASGATLVFGPRE
jgi:hypothetical protein